MIDYPSRTAHYKADELQCISSGYSLEAAAAELSFDSTIEQGHQVIITEDYR
jgi:hypothetical protein